MHVRSTAPTSIRKTSSWSETGHASDNRKHHAGDFPEGAADTRCRMKGRVACSGREVHVGMWRAAGARRDGRAAAVAVSLAALYPYRHVPTARRHEALLRPPHSWDWIQPRVEAMSDRRAVRLARHRAACRRTHPGFRRRAMAVHDPRRGGVLRGVDADALTAPGRAHASIVIRRSVVARASGDGAQRHERRLVGGRDAASASLQVVPASIWNTGLNLFELHSWTRGRVACVRQLI